MLETFTDFVELVVPELQRRGRLKHAYAPGTLRDKLFGRARLSDSHPASALRTFPTPHGEHHQLPGER